jgi:hypothetical protein
LNWKNKNGGKIQYGAYFAKIFKISFVKQPLSFFQFLLEQIYFQKIFELKFKKKNN